MNETANAELNIYGSGQGVRGEKERALPDYAHRELDLARAGADVFGNAIDRDKVKTVFTKWGLSLGET